MPTADITARLNAVLDALDSRMDGKDASTDDTPRGPGRPKGASIERHCVSARLSADEIAKAARIGNGNVIAGIRIALSRCRLDGMYDPTLQP